MTWNKTVMTVMLRWDYGIESRGDSGSKRWFYDNLKTKVDRVEGFWFDDYISTSSSPHLQQKILHVASQVEPDLIFFVPNKHQFTQNTLMQLSNRFPTAAWFGDDHWRFDIYSKEYAPHFSHIVTTDPWAVPKYEQMGISPFLSEWAGQLYTAPQEPLTPDQPYDHEVSFVGGANAIRRWYIQQLARLGINVECFGDGWPNGRVSYEGMEHIFRHSKINLCLSNTASYDLRFLLSNPRNILSTLRTPKKVEQVKARNFEIALAGGFQLTNYVPGIERHFDVGKEIVGYTTVYDCSELIKYYLKKPDKRCLIAKESYLRALREHTYASRMDDILNHIWAE